MHHQDAPDVTEENFTIKAYVFGVDLVETLTDSAVVGFFLLLLSAAFQFSEDQTTQTDTLYSGSPRYSDQTADGSFLSGPASFSRRG